jgi:uncharacterized glyoxalase superfamily protein PhnB
MLSPILACSDIPAAIDYYTQKLGFELVFHFPADDKGQSEFACVKLADVEILLGVNEGFVAQEDLAKRGTGIQLYINLPASLKIDDLYAQAVRENALIMGEIENRGWGERAFRIRDLDGYQFMFAQQLKS